MSPGFGGESSDIRVGVIGKGALGVMIANGISGGRLPGLRFSSAISSSGYSLDSFLLSCDVIVEAAGRDALASLGPTVIAQGKTLVILSVGALVENVLYEKLSQGPGGLILSSGAIGGLDLLRSLQISGTLENVMLRTEKQPSSLIQPWMSSDLRSELQSEVIEVEVFNGTARDAVSLFPSNANIAAAISICGLGFDETKVILVAKPNATKTRHLINIESRIGAYQLEFVNEVSAANPKSSQLAAYSVLAELVRLASAGNFCEKSERKR